MTNYIEKKKKVLKDTEVLKNSLKELINSTANKHWRSTQNEEEKLERLETTIFSWEEASKGKSV